MMRELYESDVVLYKVPDTYFYNTIELCLNDSPFTKQMVCIENGAYAGYANVAMTYSNEVGGLVMFIEEIYIREKYRGCGLGEEFIRFIRQEFDSKVKRYRLEVTQDNAGAIKLYERLGFESLDYKQMTLDL